ncbi:hypothetical protein Cch01nite_07370 [Cellulomonas chitinilytica]|uniref:DUF1453 domain-containing protein n=2 Tax=Cellulomonas chitinilytica TaxID=398759 RepID=A0A919NYK6_9CELL|nr:hypothetical protein Cch01nite_07370 [Cellulomonas chitinilytica]
MSAANAVLGLAVLAWVLWRQVEVREVAADRSPRGLLVLAAFGAWTAAQALDGAAVSPVALALVVAGVAVSAGFGALRGRLQPVWRDASGRVLRRGNALTVVLWLTAIAVHVGVDALVARVDPGAAGLAGGSLLVCLAVSLTAQRLVVRERAARLAGDAAVPAPFAVAA